MMLLCVHIPAFHLELARQTAGCDASPCLLADKADRGRVLELDERAYELGARAGQTVLQACVAAGGAPVLVHDSDHSRAIWDDMLDALDAVSPLVDDAAPGTAFLEMRGCDGAPADWIARAHTALAAFDLPVRVAAGPNKFTARAATYVRDRCICDAEEAPQLLAPLKLEVLALDTATIERLRLLGIQTLGELARLPHGPFVRRFGKEAARWHQYARGIDPAPFRPRPYTLQIAAAAYGEGSAAQEEQVYFALRVLADRICADLGRAGKAVALLRTTFECENGDIRAVEAGFAQATGDPRTIVDILRAKLEGLTFESPITGLRLEAIRLEECGSAAMLFAHSQPDPHALGIALERLRAINGVQPHSVQLRPAHRLEDRFVYGHPEVTRDPEECTTRGSIAPQLRLLPMREVAVNIRGNAPAKVDTKTVVTCAGPWRLDECWFEENNAVARDEYDVLLDDGMLCRIYRQGERWYVRGTYD
ncbi:MAG TPA: DNA polymerase Y family protein [Candidatus Rubrimentiphilum sp.]|nr:DNA polymerase Y family protein [Candidatus Rubrimentiphilum sp.]